MRAFVPAGSDQNLYTSRLRRTGYQVEHARARYENAFGVLVEITSVSEVEQIVAVLELPDRRYEETCLPLYQNNFADIWVNVEGFVCEFQSRHRLDASLFLEDSGEVYRIAVDHLRWFSEVIDRPVVCRREMRPDSLSEPSHDAFTIWLWSSAEANVERLDHPPRIWGFQPRHIVRSYTASGQGMALMDEETGYCVGEVFPDHLFIHSALVALGSNRTGDLEILREALRRTTEVLDLDPEAFEARMEAARQAEESRRREAYKLLIGERFMRTLSRRREEFGVTTSRLAKARLELQHLIRQQQTLAAQIRGMEQDGQEQALADEFDRILGLPKVTELKVVGHKIVVETTPLYCQDPNTMVVHRLGSMTITIDTQADDTKHVIRWKCIDGTVGYHSYPAPHVVHNGYACLGNAAQQVQELLELHDWEGLVHLAIMFVEQVNITDIAGRELPRWPRATPEELVGTEWEGQQVNQAA